MANLDPKLLPFPYYDYFLTFRGIHFFFNLSATMENDLITMFPI